MITHNQIINYFDNITTQLIELKSFFRMDLTEITGAFRSSANFPCLVLESHEGDLSNSNQLETVNIRTFAFTIYDKPSYDDYNDQNTKLTTAEQLGLKVIARMKHDASQPTSILYRRFKVNTVTYSKVGPVFNEQLYGYRFIGTLEGSESLKLNPSDWADSPTVCS